MTADAESGQAIGESRAQGAALENRLRAELAERSVNEASGCPAWAPYARWLREHGDAAIGEWLELALTGQQREADRERLLAAAEAALVERERIARRVWTGELGWSVWFGPFLLAYVGPAAPDAVRLRADLGLHARFLTDQRVWIAGAPDSWQLAELEPGQPLLLGRTLPGAQAAIVEHLLGELREHYGKRRVVEAADVSWRWDDGGMRMWVVAPPPVAEGHGLISCATGETLTWLHWDRVRSLETLAVVGPPELLARWPGPATRADVFGPPPAFERRYAELAAAHPALIGQLRAELDERPLSEAHGCPSWIVFLDWLLERGDELLAQWLRLALEQPGASRRQRRLASRFCEALGPVRRPERHGCSSFGRRTTDRREPTRCGWARSCSPTSTRSCARASAPKSSRRCSGFRRCCSRARGC